MNASSTATNSPTLSVSSVVKRLPRRLVKPVALLVSGAIALGGVTLVQTWMSAQEADAITFSNGWDGVFTKDQLWYKNVAYGTFRAWDSPGAITSVTSSDPPIKFERDSSDPGNTAVNWGETIAVGPVFKQSTGGQQDQARHMVTWGSAGRVHVLSTVAGSGGANTLSYTDFGDFDDATAVSGVTASWCDFSNRWSGEINQKNGYLYQIGTGAAPTWNGDNSAISLALAIYRLNKGPGTIDCLAAANSVTDAGGTLNAQWTAMTGQPASGNWNASSDMAIDAEGNFYTFLRKTGSTSGGQPANDSRHALVRINVDQNADGTPKAGVPWTYTLVKAFTQASSGDENIYGMAFIDGNLYTAGVGSQIRRWDTLSGVQTSLGNANGAALDLAGAQMAPVISGTVYNDVNGDGTIGTGEGGVPNVTVEIFQNTGANQWTKRGEVVTATNGTYSALLNSASSEFAVRVKRPQIDGVNAQQTYASAGSFYESGTSGTHNTLTAYCTTTNGGDYTASTAENNVCPGARNDGIDALNTAQGATGDPFAATGGAAIVSKVTMTTDLAVVQADFGLTKAASWGDSPLLHTTNAQSGPYANPLRAGLQYLRLGENAQLWPDGVNDPHAAAHNTDDGLYVVPLDSQGQPASGTWAPAQGFTMVKDQAYRFRAKAAGDAAAVSASHVKIWLTSLTASGQAATSFDTAVACQTSTPDVNGYVYCDYTPTGTLPSGGIAAVQVRARISNDPGVTATSRDPADPSASSWVPAGEIEDYELGVAGSVLRIQARTLGSVAANVNLSFTNIANSPPLSQTTDSILTNSANAFVPSTTGHAVSNRTQGITISTTGVGAQTATNAGNWKLATGAADTRCYDTKTQQNLTPAITGNNLTLPAPAGGGQLPEEIICELTYIPAWDEATSTITANNGPLTVKATSDVVVRAESQVRNAVGDLVGAPAVGTEVTLTLEPDGGTLATATGAFFIYYNGTDWIETTAQSYICVIGTNYNCSSQVRVGATKSGTYLLKAQSGGVYVKNLSNLQPTSTYPVEITFTADNEPGPESSFAITSTGQKFAATSKTGNPEDYHTGVVTLLDANENPITGALVRLNWNETAPPAGLVEITEDTTPGNEGKYNVKIYSSAATTYQNLTVRYTLAGNVVDLDAPQEVVFKTRDATDPSMVITTTANQVANHGAPGLSAADWGKQTITATLADSAGNPYTSGIARLTASADSALYPGVHFANGGEFSCSVPLDSDSKCPSGVYKLDVYASAAGAKRIVVHYEGEDPAASHNLRDANSPAPPNENRYVTATYIAGPIHLPSTVFVLGDTVTNPGETNPQDDWDKKFNDDSTLYYPNGAPIDRVLGGSFHPGVRVWDLGRNNPIENANVRFVLSNPQSGTCAATFVGASSGQTSSTGKISVEVRSNIATTCVLSAEIQIEGTWQAAPNSPKTLTWKESQVASSDFTVSTATVVANGTDTGTVTVHLRDANGLPITTLAGDISADSVVGQATSGVNVGTFTHSSTTPGEYTATFTGTKVNEDNALGWELSAIVNSQPIALLTPNGNEWAKFEPDTPRAPQSWLLQPAGSVVVGTPTQNVVAHVRDFYGNDVADGTPVTFTIPANTTGNGTAGPSSSIVATTTNGLATLAVSSTDATWDNTPAYHAVTATVGGASIANVKDADTAAATPIRTDGIVRLVFAPDDPVPGQSWLVEPAGTAEANGTTTLQVRAHLRDGFGNNVADGTEVRFSIPTGVSAGSTSGAATVVVGTAGGYADIYLTSTDATWDNTPPYHSITAVIVNGGAQITDIRAADETTQLTRPNNDAQLVYTSGTPCPTESWLLQPAGSVEVGTDTQNVVAHVRDCRGNDVANGTEVTFAIPANTTGNGTAGPSTSIVATTTGGKATLAVSSTDATWDNTPAYHAVSARVGGVPIAAVKDVDTAAATPIRADGIVRLVFEPGPIGPNQSWLVQPSPATALADNQATLTVKARAKDALDNDLNTGTVTFVVPARMTAQSGSTTVSGGASGSTIVADIAAGYATVAYKTTTADSYVITAETAGGDAISAVKNAAETAADGPQDGKVELTFSPLVGADGWLIQPDGTGQKANKSDLYVVRVHAKDSNGNDAADGTPVVFTIPAGVWEGSQEGPRDVATTTTGGYASVTVTSTDATVDNTDPYHVVTAEISGVPVTAVRNAAEATTPIRNSGDVRLVFDPDDPKPEKSWLVQPAGTALANGVETLKVRAHLQDAYENNVADGTQVRFSIPLGVSAGSTSGPATVVQATAGGYADLDLTSTDATWDNTPPYHSITAVIVSSSASIAAVKDVDTSAAPAIRTTGDVRLVYTSGPPCAPDEAWLLQPAGSVEVGATTQNVVAHVRDCSGNNVADGTPVTFTIPANTTGNGTAGPSTSIVANTTNGLATLAVSSTDATGDNTPAYHAVTAKVGGESITAVKDVDTAAASPIRTDGVVRLVFDPGPWVPGSSWLIEPSGSAEANGADTLTVKVRAKDGLGNDVADGVAVTFHIPALTRAVSGGQTYTGPIDVPATTVGGYATIEVSSETANAPGSFYGITAKSGNDSVLAVRSETEALPILRNDGIAHLVFGAGPVIAANSWLVQPDGSATANGTATQLVRVHAKDGSGNDAGAGAIIFHIPSGVSVSGQAGPADIEVNVSAGWAQIAVTSTDATGDNTPPYHAVTAGVKNGGAIATVKSADETTVLLNQDGSNRDQVRLVYVPDVVDPQATADSLTVDQDNHRADGVAAAEAYMIVQDAHGNAIQGNTDGCKFDLIYTGNGPVFVGAPQATPKTITVSDPTGLDGKCTVQIVSYYEGAYPVKGTFKTFESPGPDASRPKANFQNQAPDPEKSEFSVTRTPGNTSPTKAIADGVDSYTVTVVVRDSDNHLIGNYPVDIYASPSGSSNDVLVAQGERSGTGTSLGIATYQIKTTVAGIYRVQAKFGSTAIATAPGGTVKEVPVEFVAGEPDWTKSSVVYSQGDALPDDIGVHTAQVTLRDSHDNLVSGANVFFTLETALGHFVDQNNQNLGQGTQTLTTSDVGVVGVRIKKAGIADEDVTLKIWLGSTTGTPVATHVFNFVAGGPSPANSSFVITQNPASGTPDANGVDYYQGVVTVRDINNIALAGKPVTFEFDSAGVTVTPAGPYTTNSNGQVVVTFTSTTAKAYTVNAGVGGGNARPEDQEIEFEAGPAVASKSTLTTTGSAVLANGADTHDATVVVRDAFDNPVAGQDVFFTIDPGNTSITGPTLSGTTVSSDAAGVAKVTITSNEPGTFAVNGYLGTSAAPTQLVGNSPRSVQFSAGEPDPSKSSRWVVPDTDSDPDVSVVKGDSYRITTEIISIANIKVDKANVRLVIDTGAGVLTVTPQDQTNPQITGEATSDHYGTYYWDVTTNAGGVYQAHVELWATVGATTGYHQVGAPIELRFHGGVVKADHSWLVEPGGSAVADGVAEQSVVVKAFDDSDNPATSGTVRFAVPAGVSVVGGPNPGAGPRNVDVEVQAGEAAIRVVSTVANVNPGTPYYGVTARVTAPQASVGDITTVKDPAGTVIANRNGVVHIVFTPGQPEAANSVLSIPTAAGTPGTKIANGAEAHRAEVVVRDSNSNLVGAGAAQVVFSYKHTDLAGAEVTGSWPAVATNAAGVASRDFTSLVATDWEISATIQGVEVSASPQTATFVAGPVDVRRTLDSFEVDSDTKPTNGMAPAYARVKAQDAQGNPVAGVALVLRLQYPETENGPKFNNALTGPMFVTVTSLATGFASANIFSVWERLGVNVRAELDQQVSANKQVNFASDPASTTTSRFRVDRLTPNGGTANAVADGAEGYRVTVTLRNENGDLLRGSSGTVVITPVDTTAGASASSPTVTTGTDGTATFDFKTTYAGDWKIAVQIGAGAVPREDDPLLTPREWPVVFQPGPPAADHSRLVGPTGGPAQANSSDEQIVLAEIKDAHDNPIPGASVVFTIPTDIRAKVGGSLVAGPTVTVTTSDGSAGGVKGTARLVLASAKTGLFDVTAKIGAADITTGSPARVEFVNTALSLSDSEFTITSTPPKVAGVDSHTAQVVLKDASGNVFTASRDVYFSYRLQNTSAWQEGPKVPTTSAGVAVWSFTQPVAGTYEILAEVGSGTVQGRVPDDQTIRTVVFVHGLASAQHSSFQVSAGKALADDSATHTATLTIRDANDNLVSGESVTFALTNLDNAHFVTTGCDPRTCTKVTSDTGVVEVKFASPDEGTVTVSGSLSGNRLVGTGTALFRNDAAVAAESDWTITPAGPITADGVQQYTAVVNTRDQYHNIASDAEVQFSWSPTVVDGLAITETGRYASNASGVLTVHFTAKKTGTYTVNALIAGEKVPVADKQIVFNSGPISLDPDKTFLTPPNTSAQANGVAEQVVTATVKDANNNPVLDAWVKFQVPANTQLVQGTDAEVQVDANGQARLRLVSTHAGPYSVTAEARKGTSGTYASIVGGSPAAVNFVAGPVDLAHSVISKSPAGPRDATGLPEHSYTVTVELKDAFDNPVKVSGTPIAITLQLYTPDGLTLVQGVAPVVRNVQTDGDGVASTTFTTTRAGIWKGTGGPASGDVVSGSPVSLQFDPTGVSAAASVFDASKNQVLANGTEQHSAWVIAKDANGNPKAGVSVQFTVTEGAADVAGPVTAPASGLVTTCDFYDSGKPAWCTEHGMALVYITSNEPGTFNASATIANQLVTGAPKEVSFDSGPADASQSSYTVTPDSSVQANWPAAVDNPADRYTVTVTVNSANHILVPNAQVRLNGLDSNIKIVSGAATGSTGVPGSGSYGAYTWALYTDVAGTYTADVQVWAGNQWMTIAPAQFTITYKAGDPKADHSWLVEPGGTAVANGTAEQLVVVKAFDSSNNPATSGKVEFHVPAGVSVVGGPSPGAGPRDVEVSIVAGEAGIRVVSTTANTTVGGGSEYYIVTAEISEPAASVGAIATVKDAAGQVIAGRNGQVRLVYVPGTGSGIHSVLTIPTAGQTKVVGGTDEHTARVVVKDENDSPVPGKAVRFEWTTGTQSGPASGATWTTVNAGLSDASGVATYEFAAPNNEAGWVWVKAAFNDGAWINVGGSQTNPVASQTVLGAEFQPDTVDPTETQRSFETYGPAVLNDLATRSWARVVVQDQYGNGIGGLDVTFTLPASQAGTLGTPVFVDGNTPPTSKTFTVRSCERNLTAVPDQCKREGVYTPGLAYVEVVSNYEGAFPVSGTVSQSNTNYDAGHGTVSFESPTGSQGSFTVAQTDPSAPAVVANGIASYTVTATILGQTPTGLKPASGACVAPNLPAHVTVKAPLPNSAGCGAGSFTTDLNGQVSFQIVSTQAGAALIGAKLAGVDLPTEPGGSVFTRQVVFAGGSPSALHSELISPSTPARADDPAGQTVLAVIRDAYGNLAACWAGGVQVTCEVEFDVPAQTRTGQGAAQVTGPARVRAHTSLIDFSAPNPLIASIAASITYYGAVGTHDITATVDGQPIMVADGVVASRGAAEAHITFTDSTPPGRPIVNPSDGGHVDGSVAQEDRADAAAGELEVVVTDENDVVLARCAVDTDGTFDCPIVPKVPDSTELKVVIEDASNNRTDPPVEIITDGIPPGQPVVNPSDGEHVDGTVAEEDLDDAANGDLVVVVTDENGTVVATCPVRADGTFDCPIDPGVPDGTELEIVITDPAGNETQPPVDVVTDGVAPGRPIVDESDGTHVTGEVPEGDRGDAADGELTVVVTDDDGDVVARCQVRPDGTFDCPIAPALPDGETIHVVIVDPAGNESNPVDRVVDAVPPGDPVLNESNGTNVTGHVAEEDLGDAAHGDLSVVVRDEDGDIVTTCPVNVDGTFNCTFNPRLPDGEEVTVEIVDRAGNTNDSEIVIDGVSPGTPVLEPSRGDEVTGFVPSDDLRDAANGDLTVIVTDPDTGLELCRSQVAADGSWSCTFDPAIPDGTIVEVTVIDRANNVSDQVSATIDSTPPILPVPDPSAGETLTGIGEEQGNQITVTDAQGTVLCEAVVGANRAWSCDLNPAAAEGDILTITEEDAAHNVINRPWRIGIPEIALAKPTLCLGDRQVATGLNFQPGETITAVTSGEVRVGQIRANSDGAVVFQWVIPENTPRNVHTLTLRGPLSGVHTVDFSVTCGGVPADIEPPKPAPVKAPTLPFTGADGILGMAGATLGLLLAGLLLLLAAKRRRRTEETS